MIVLRIATELDFLRQVKVFRVILLYMKLESKVLYFILALSALYLLVSLGSCSLLPQPDLTVEVGLCNSSTISGVFNFGATIKNVGGAYAYKISYDLKLYGSDPGYWQTNYTIDPPSLIEPDQTLDSNAFTIMGFVGTTENWIIISYILTITYQNKSGKNMEPAEVSGYFNMQDY